MNPTNTADAPRAGPPPDDLDRLLGDFFKGRRKRPWPAAPVPGEPTGLAPVPVELRNKPLASAGEHGTRARLTLAVSVAILLGGCWALSNGLPPAGRPDPKPGAVNGPGVLDPSNAEGSDPLKTMRENTAKDAKNPVEGFVPGPINLP
jgi:hypothetical protein